MQKIQIWYRYVYIPIIWISICEKKIRTGRNIFYQLLDLPAIGRQAVPTAVDSMKKRCPPHVAPGLRFLMV